MHDLISSFIKAYAQGSTWDISLEIIAASCGIISVCYAMREDIKVYPIGMISTMTYIYITYRAVLYGDMLINLYYTGMSLYGWYRWTHPKGDQRELPISKASREDWLKTGLIFFSSLLFIVAVYGYANKFYRYTSYVDTLTTALFFAGMWLMANKKIENWHVWIVADLISIPLYFIKGLGFSALQFGVFTVLAAYGLKDWQTTYARRALQQPVPADESSGLQARRRRLERQER